MKQRESVRRRATWRSPIACLLAAGIALGVASAGAAEHIRAEFEVRHAGAKVGEVSWDLRVGDDGAVVFATDNRATGLARLLRDVTVVARSEGVLTTNGYRTQAYVFERSGDKRATRIDARFDHAAEVLTLTRDGETSTRALQGGLVDELGHLLTLGQMLARGERQPRLRVLRRHRERDYAYVLDGAERVDSAVGSHETLRLRRTRKGGDRSTTIWSAPDLRYLPVRISHREKSRRVDIVLLRWSREEY